MAAKSDPTKPLQPLDLVFSCNVCHDSIRDICSPLQDEKGLDGTQKPVAKLWMTECAHLICAKHLAGGGKRRLPFFWSTLMLFSSSISSRRASTTRCMSGLCWPAKQPCTQADVCHQWLYQRRIRSRHPSPLLPVSTRRS